MSKHKVTKYLKSLKNVIKLIRAPPGKSRPEPKSSVKDAQETLKQNDAPVCEGGVPLSALKMQSTYELVSLTRHAHEGKGLGVLTSGGDSQGMNAAIMAVVRFGIYLGCKVFFIKEGYEGMIAGGSNIVETRYESVSLIIEKGGTVIGSARCPEFFKYEGRLKACKNLLRNGISNVVAIGGDGTLTGMDTFKREWSQMAQELLAAGEISQEQFEEGKVFKVVGLVGSIDNDFCGTGMTIGADTALNRIVECVDLLSVTAWSHQRVFIVEVMGRHCGYLALAGALATEADFVFCPECPPPEDWADLVCERLLLERRLGERASMIILSEGAVDKEGQPITAEMVKKEIVKRGNLDSRVTVLGHLQRGGKPSVFDRMLGCRMAVRAVLKLVEDDDAESAVMSLQGNCVTSRPLVQSVEETRRCSKALEEKDFCTAIKLRGAVFQRHLTMCQTLTCQHPLDSESACKVALVHVGPPTPGMNAAVWAFTRTSLDMGVSVLGVHNGIQGFRHGNIQNLSWTDVTGFVSAGGSMLHSKRNLPNEYLEDISASIIKNKIKALVIIGGFDAVVSGLELLKARKTSSSFDIPIVVIPCSISNNIAGTEYSIGSDTALNAATEVCDRVKLSAKSSDGRVFVIETQGEHCGYIAAMTALACGADVAYIDEERVTINELKKDVHDIIVKMKNGIRYGIVLRSEKATDHYDSDFIHKMYSEEGRHMFTTRKNILGHLQQGFAPTAFDRVLAVHMGVLTAQWVMKFLKSSQPADGDESVVLIGINGEDYTFTPLVDVAKMTDFEKSRPKKQWWMHLRQIFRICAKHDYSYEEEYPNK